MDAGDDVEAALDAASTRSGSLTICWCTLFGKYVVQRAAVDGELAGAGDDAHAGDRLLATAGRRTRRGRRSRGRSDALAEVSAVYDDGPSASGRSASTSASRSASGRSVSVASVVTSDVLLVGVPCCGFGVRLLRDLGDLERHRLLRLVRVLGAGVDLELRELLTAELVVGQHALDGLLDGACAGCLASSSSYAVARRPPG